MSFPDTAVKHDAIIEIGGLPISVQTDDAGFADILRARYRDFIRPASVPQFSLSVKLSPSQMRDPEADVEVWLDGPEWKMRRGDFSAFWNPVEGRGQICQTANPYAIDSVLRIVHTLMLAPAGGFLLHASSAIRNGKAFLFSGVSEAGKTTMARLAPADAILLTDEASYVRKAADSYIAYGTPFAGELAEPGRNISAPIAALYLLKKSPKNCIEQISAADAIQRVLRNILFFAHQPEFVRQVFDSACAFVTSVPVYQLSFFPDEHVWDLIG